MTWVQTGTKVNFHNYFTCSDFSIQDIIIIQTYQEMCLHVLSAVACSELGSGYAVCGGEGGVGWCETAPFPGPVYLCVMRAPSHYIFLLFRGQSTLRPPQGIVVLGCWFYASQCTPHWSWLQSGFVCSLSIFCIVRLPANDPNYLLMITEFFQFSFAYAHI